jgi:hypothetical protein
MEAENRDTKVGGDFDGKKPEKREDDGYFGVKPGK